MDTPRLAPLLLEKLDEQIDGTVHLVAKIPEAQAEWRPLANAWSLAELVGHLLDCLAGFCATLNAMYPQELAHFQQLRDLPVGSSVSLTDASRRIDEYRAAIEEGMARVTNEELARKIPTVFVADGEPVLTLLLGNLEHLINHKFQLFFYLKTLGIPVATPDLYRLRGQGRGDSVR